MAATTRISVQDLDGVPLIRFLDRQLYADAVVREAIEQLYAAVPRSTDPIALILDFGAVEMVSSALLGKLIQIQRRVDVSKGRLVLCDLRPAIVDVLKTTNLRSLFQIVRDRREARESFGEPGAR